MASSNDRVQSVDKAFLLLDTMAKAGHSVSLQELAASLGWAKSSVHRMLSTMRESHIVEQSQQDGKYSLGSHLFELGCAASNSWEILRLARPYLQRVACLTNESACLATVVDGEVLVLDFVDSINPWHIVSRPGAKLPAHCTVQGKIMLAQMSPLEVQRILRERGMHRYTPNTICEIPAMQQELEQIRLQGYAVDNSEYRTGLCSVAAPIYDENREVRYTISVVSMFGSPEGPKFREVVSLVLAIAGDISRALGCESCTEGMLGGSL